LKYYKKSIILKMNIENKRRKKMKRLILALLLIGSCTSGEIDEIDPSLDLIITDWNQIFIDVDSDGINDGFLFNVTFRVINNGGYAFDSLEAWIAIKYENEVIEIIETGDCMAYNVGNFSLTRYIENIFIINDVYFEDYYWE